MFRECLNTVKQPALGFHKYVEEIVSRGANKHRSLICTRRFSQIKALNAMYHLLKTTPPDTKRFEGRSLDAPVDFRDACPYVAFHHRELEALKHYRPAVTPPLPQWPGG